MNFVALLCLFGVACVASAQATLDVSNSSNSSESSNAKILRYDYHNKGLGDYNFELEQTDGTKHQQQGELINKGSGDSLSVKGSYSFIGPDGVTYTTTYTADDKGFNPEIEQGPGGEVPAVILASMVG